MNIDLKKSRCLVLGAGGFLGRNLCHSLSESGADVIGFDRGPCPEELKHFIRWKTGDFSCLHDYSEEASGANIIFHLVATTVPGTSNSDIEFDIDTNLKTTVQLLEYCRKYNDKKIIYASSGGAVYGVPAKVPVAEEDQTNPISSYGIVKLAVEKYLALFGHLYGLDYQILRIANPFGPYQNGMSPQGAVASFMYKMLSGKPIEIWGNGEVIRDYVYVKDVMKAFLSALSYGGSERIFNIGSGRGLSLNRLLREVSTVTGRNPDIYYRDSRKTDVPEIVLDCSLAREELGWTSQVPFVEALKSTKNWMQNQILNSKITGNDL